MSDKPEERDPRHFDLTGYHLMTMEESWGASGSSGIKIFAKSNKIDLSPRGRMLEEDPFRRECYHARYKLERDLQNQIVHEDPMGPVRKASTQRTLLAAFSEEIIFAQEIPNEYPDGDEWDPWYLVSTEMGMFKIGWRRRVINLDWSRTKLKRSGKDLFPNEDVTRGEDGEKESYFIHCYGHEKAKEYVRRLFDVWRLQKTQQEKWVIHGSYGDIITDADGLILPGQDISKEYADILRYDTAEYRAWAKENNQELDKLIVEVDCVDIGMWVGEMRSPKYVPGEKEHRLMTIRTPIQQATK